MSVNTVFAPQNAATRPGNPGPALVVLRGSWCEVRCVGVGVINAWCGVVHGVVFEAWRGAIKCCVINVVRYYLACGAWVCSVVNAQ